MTDTARIEAHLPLVRRIAGEVRRSLGGRAEIGDLIAYGTEGLIHALDRFDPKRGITFSSFAYYRIRGAVWDGVRKMGWKSRRTPEAALARFQAGANLALQQAADDAPAAASADEADAIARTIARVGVAYVVSFDLEAVDRQASETPNPEAQTGDASERAFVRRALTTLPEKERTLLLLMYFEDKSLTEAGAAIGLSKSWACRLHARALELLGDALSERGFEGPQPEGAGRR